MKRIESTSRGLPWEKISLLLGALSLAAIGLAHLALTDIHHGEGDLRAEWTAVQICALVILSFHAAALTTLARTLRGKS